MKRRILGCVIALLFIFGIPWIVSAQTENRQMLRQEIESLKERLQDLERRLEVEEEESAEAEAEARIERLRAAEEDIEAEPPEEPAKDIDIGGALRVNYSYQSFNDESEAKRGDLAFDIFRLDIDGTYNDILLSLQYRWYSYQDVIHHGWIGYNFTEEFQGQLGVTQVPFGILPFASHNWWFGVPYYVGLEDDYDMGIKFLYEDDPWDLQFAFFKNGEWANASKLERYSYDIVKAEGQFNEETNQVNARLAYTLDHGDFGSTEIGVSGQWGQLRNSESDDEGDHWAGAAHLNGFYGPFNLMLQAAYYENDPKNPPGVDDDVVIMGAFADSFPVAAEGALYLAGLSYDVPVEWGPVNKLTFYNDYSILVKEKDGFEDSQINTLGALISANPVFTYVDLIMGKNMLYLGGPDDSLAAGEDGDWETRFNINVGYYF